MTNTVIADPEQDRSRGRRRVVVNADDFGLSDGVNQGILAAHRDGIVTSASLMVRRAHAASAVELARTGAPALSIGLHLELVEHQALDGEWVTVQELVDLNDETAVERETRHQLEQFVELQNGPPTHLDSHQHTHLAGRAGPVVARIAAEWGVPLRSVTMPYRGSFYGQYGAGIAYPDGVTTAALLAAVCGGTDELIEVGCHPAAFVDFDDTYCNERVAELEALCDPLVGLALEMAGIELVSRNGRTRSRRFEHPAGS